MTAADAPTLAQLAADVEAGLIAGAYASANWPPDTRSEFMGNINAAQAALEAYRKQVGELEAALEPWARLYNGYMEYCSEARWHGDFLDYLTMFTGGDNVDAYGERSARALLSAAESEGGDGER